MVEVVVIIFSIEEILFDVFGLTFGVAEIGFRIRIVGSIFFDYPFSTGIAVGTILPVMLFFFAFNPDEILQIIRIHVYFLTVIVAQRN